MRVDFRGPQYREERASAASSRQALLARAQTLPGVREAAITTRPRLDDAGDQGRGAQGPPENRESRAAPVSTISAAFPRSLGMTLVSGRWFEDVERRARRVDQRDPGARAITRASIRSAARSALPWLGEKGYGTIVGVVADLKYTRIDADTKPEVFFHHCRRRTCSASRS